MSCRVFFSRISSRRGFLGGAAPCRCAGHAPGLGAYFIAFDGQPAAARTGRPLRPVPAKPCAVPNVSEPEGQSRLRKTARYTTSFRNGYDTARILCFEQLHVLSARWNEPGSGNDPDTCKFRVVSRCNIEHQLCSQAVLRRQAKCRLIENSAVQANERINCRIHLI